MESAAFKIAAGRTPGIHVVLASTAHTFARHTHDEFGIGVITSGAQRWQSGRMQVEAGRGCAIAVNPGEVHDGSPVDESGRAWRMLYISSHVVDSAAGDVFSRSPQPFEFVSPVLADPRVAYLVRQLIAAESSAASHRIRSEELLLMLTARTGVRRRASLPPVPPSIRLAKQRIDDDPVSPLSLGDLAALSSVSRFQLLRSFVRSTGFTPHAYVVQRRIDLARQLIFRGGELAEVAAASGFADQSHMTRTFVRKYGVAPGAYARAIR